MSTKKLIESSTPAEEIVTQITEQVEEYSGVKFDTDYWKKEFGLGDFEDVLEEYTVREPLLKKIGEASDKVNKEGMRIIGGSPEQRLYSQGSIFIVNVGGREDKIPFNEQAKFNCHVLYFAIENGDPTKFLQE